MDRPLAEQLVTLRHALARLRRKRAWKAHVRGGVYTVEVTRNAGTGLFHPHVHIVADCDYYPHAELAALWESCMEGGRHVWIREVRDRAAAGWELAKYVGKPPAVRDFPPAAIVEYVHATGRARMFNTFGSCYPCRLRDVPDWPADSPQSYRVPIERIVALARTGVAVAGNLATLIRRRWPVFRAYIDAELPELPELATFERHAQFWRMISAGVSDPERAPPPPGRLADRLDADLMLTFCTFRAADDAGEFVRAEFAAA